MLMIVSIVHLNIPPPLFFFFFLYGNFEIYLCIASFYTTKIIDKFWNKNKQSIASFYTTKIIDKFWNKNKQHHKMHEMEKKNSNLITPNKNVRYTCVQKIKLEAKSFKNGILFGSDISWGRRGIFWLPSTGSRDWRWHRRGWLRFVREIVPGPKHSRRVPISGWLWLRGRGLFLANKKQQQKTTTTTCICIILH